MQHANLKGRSTKPTLQDFAYKVDGSVALGVFLDEEGAFGAGGVLIQLKFAANAYSKAIFDCLWIPT
jgi:hypothetical protein